MNVAMPAQQRGITFGGFVFGAFLLVIVSVFGLKLIPLYIQDAQIKKIFNDIANDPEMQKASLREVRSSFDRRSTIDAIKAIKSEDIELTSENGKPFLSASYSVKIPLLANASLVLDFNPTSAK